MKKGIFTAIILNILVFDIAIPQTRIEYSKLRLEAEKLYEQNLFESSCAKYEEAFKINSTISIVLYNGACSAALCGKYQLAIEMLKKAIANGYIDDEHLEKDPDLYKLHLMPEWSEVSANIKLEKSKTKTSEQIFAEICLNIERNDTTGILKLCSSDYKTRVKEYEIVKNVNLVYKILNESRLKEIHEKDAMPWYDDNLHEIKRFEYSLTPNYFRYSTSGLLQRNKIDYFLRLDFIRINHSWYLNDLIFNRNYLSISFELGKYINDFFMSEDSCNVEFRIFSKTKHIVGLTQLSNVNLRNCFSNLEYKNIVEFNKSKIDSSKIFSISFNQRKLDISSFFSTSKSINNFEVIFFDDHSNLCLICTQDKHAFYKMQNIHSLKDIIYDELNMSK